MISRASIKTMPPTIMEANQFGEKETSAPQKPIMLKWEENEKRGERNRKKSNVRAQTRKD